MSNTPGPPAEEHLTWRDGDVVAEFADESPAVAGESPADQGDAASAPRRRGRRKRLPLVLFLLTCVSTCLAGATGWMPAEYLLTAVFGQDAMPLRRALISHWADGLIYMVCVLGILLTHEMGHFLAAVWHRIPASLPFFLPLPISMVGTMGAVIALDGRRADRRQTFDIGLAGPLAGLIVAMPILWLGIQKLDPRIPAHGQFTLSSPLAAQLMTRSAASGAEPVAEVWYSQLNPYFMAGWVGLLITGLNMLPVSQLDGGHVLYTVLGRRIAHWFARGFMAVAAGYIVWLGAWMWLPMMLIVLLIGTDHPPTRDDRVPLGWYRLVLGGLALLIPVFCFSPQALRLVAGSS
jgi:membrane-associated protease RseP (regulator of RpoE activity)